MWLGGGGPFLNLKCDPTLLEKSAKSAKNKQKKSLQYLPFIYSEPNGDWNWPNFCILHLWGKQGISSWGLDCLDYSYLFSVTNTDVMPIKVVVVVICMSGGDYCNSLLWVFHCWPDVDQWGKHLKGIAMFLLYTPPHTISSFPFSGRTHHFPFPTFLLTQPPNV